MYLIITIDVEEDNWDEYQPEHNTVENIKKIPALQELFDEFGVKPTYLITYPVATDPFSIDLFKSYLDQGKCEIGMHCHPWNTPPIEEEVSDYNSMLCNLPDHLVEQKLSVLHATIGGNFGIAPISFRAGRWGFSPAVARVLHQLGCKVDTSVSPYIDWRVYHGPDFSRYPLHPYRFNPEDIAVPNESGQLFEIPATVGFLQNDFKLCQRWSENLATGMGRKFRIKGILNGLGLLNKVWLSPELSDAKSMVKLAKRLKQKGCLFLNMSFHSPTLRAGMTPFVKTGADVADFLGRIKTVLAYAVEANYEFISLSDVEKLSVLRDSVADYSRATKSPLPCVGSL